MKTNMKVFEMVYDISMCWNQWSEEIILMNDMKTCEEGKKMMTIWRKYNV